MTQTDRQRTGPSDGVTAGATPPVQPRLGVVGGFRWAWRQLTSMRTALFLLLLVAIAAVPGSIWPQRSVDVNRVTAYLEENPTVGPWLDRIGMFDVYTSPWFSAIYLLLMVSLIGCVIPRTRLHWHALTSRPPAAPRRLQRLTEHRIVEVDGDAADVANRVAAYLRRRRYRVRVEGGVVSAETGYLRESGNLLFHVALVLLTVALAWGHLVGWRGDRIVPVGESFANSAGSYHTWSAGPWVDTTNLEPFVVTVDSLDVTFEDRAGGTQMGAPRDFRARTTVLTAPGAAPQQRELSVNGPLNISSTSVYLLGNGYAPVITVRDVAGAVVYRQATPFLPQDNFYTSAGVVKVTGASPTQLGLSGFFYPTAVVGPSGPTSAFPDLRRPALLLDVYEGDLFPSARPQSVYTLDTAAMTQLKTASGAPLKLSLQPGETVQLPDGRGSVTFESVVRWAGVSTRYDPAKPLALGSSLLALAGLLASLLIRRRRVFVRVTPASIGAAGVDAAGGVGNVSRVELGALAKSEDAMLGDVVDRLTASLGARPADAAAARSTLERTASTERDS